MDYGTEHVSGLGDKRFRLAFANPYAECAPPRTEVMPGIDLSGGRYPTYQAPAEPTLHKSKSKDPYLNVSSIQILRPWPPAVSHCS